MAKNKVTYGLSNVHVWPISDTTDAGVPTYGAVIAVPGGVEMTMDAKGSSDPFYADNGTWWTGTSNNGYSGKAKFAQLPEDFRTKIMKEIVDKNGVIFEDATVTPAEFAMAFEFEGDVNKVRHVFYRCTATRPSVASKTKEDKISPNTDELTITAMPRMDNGQVKASLGDSTSTAYAEWYGTTPYVYVAATT